MKLLFEYGLFLAKTVTLVVAITFILTMLGNLTQRKRRRGELRITQLSKQYRDIKEEMSISLLNSSQQKLWRKEQKKKLKQESKFCKSKKKFFNKQTNNINDNKKARVFVIDFKGSLDAHEVTSLREEVTAVLSVARAQDQVVLRLESQGGVVHGYGLAASQLQRLREKKIFLIATVDKIAASGGYMMACVANKIIAAPFSIIGSIGVAAQIPNFNRLLKKNEIDIELHTTGQYKRTLTMLGENTDEGRQKFLENLNETHYLFKDFVKKMRPSLDVEQVANGKYWYGIQAIEKDLIDEVGTSDDLLLNLAEDRELIGVRFISRKKILNRLAIINAVIYSIEKLIFNFFYKEKERRTFSS